MNASNDSCDVFLCSNFSESLNMLNSNIMYFYGNPVLIWVPCIFLWIFSPLEAYYLKTSKFRDIPCNIMNILKMIFIAIATTINLINVIDVIFKQKGNSSFDILNAILGFITFILCFVLTWANLKRGLRSSSILFAFSFILVICGLPGIQNIVLKELNGNTLEAEMIWFILYYISVLMMFVINCFLDPKPKRSLNKENRDVCPSHNATLLSKILLSWFTPFVWKNYKNPVETNLWDLDTEDTASYVSDKMEKYFNRSLDEMKLFFMIRDSEQVIIEEKRNSFVSANKKFSIIKLLIKEYKFPFMVDAFWKALDALMILNYPLIYSYLVSYVKEEEASKMYLCAFLFAVNASLDAIVLARHYQGVTRLQTRVRSALMTIMYKKMLKTSDTARREYTSGELTTLLTDDINRIVDSIMHIQNLWVAPFQFLFSFYFIWNIFGFCTIFSVILMIILIPINKYLLDVMLRHVNIEIDHRDKRGKFTQDLLAGMKALKIFAWESSFQEKASQLRSEEEETLKKGGTQHAWLLFLYNCIPILMPCASFGAYYYISHNVIDAGKAFITISFFNTFKSPLRVISNYIPSIIQASISVKRIDSFLNSAEFDDRVISHDPSDAALLMVNATFSRIDSSEAISLRDSSLKINKGALVTIVGPVGSGKSSLILAFLGEMQKISGYVNVDGEIAYVPQQSWILNATFKNNITLGEATSELLYRKALKACALDVDLKTFLAGDSTEMGEKGINLSGGQKQRITIARAICREADIYFFDDSISAVDFQVSKHIFEHVLGCNGILNNRTRILVTHSAAFLSQSDLILVMQNGRIVEQGTYQDLLKSDGYVSVLMANQIEGEGGSQNVSHENLFEDIEIKNIIRKKSSVFIDRKLLEALSKETGEMSDHGKMIEKELVETSSIKKEVYIFLFSMVGFTVIFWVLVLNILTQIFSICSRLWLTTWSAANSNESEISHSQTYYILIFASLGLAEAVSVLIADKILLQGVYRASSTIYKTLVSSVLKWPLWLIDSTPVGRIIYRATSDIYVLDNITCTRLISCLELGNKFFVIILVTCYITPISIVIFVVVFIIVYFVQCLYGSMAHQLERINSNNKAPLSSYFVETISGLTSIRANKFDDNFISMLYEKIDLYSSAPYALVVNYRWCSIRLETLYGFAVFLIIFFTLRQRDYMEKNMIFFAISYAIQWTKEFQWFLSYLMDLESALISVERIKNYIDSPQESNSEISHQIIVPNEWPHEGNVQFENFSLRYRQSAKSVLKELTFTVNSGEKIGIVGRTGAGKSSLIVGLLRLEEPSSGAILIDNIDIAKIDLEILRSRLTILPQDPVLFIGTLRFNLDPCARYTDDMIWNALEKSYLKDFIRQLPNGLEYLIEEGGANLSSGQKQLLCLARAILRKSKILILDEATASIDVETDELVQKTIRQEFADCTVLTVAHRLNTIQDYDKIMVLEEGNIIEYDKVENLLRDKDSIFYNLMLKAGLIQENES